MTDDPISNFLKGGADAAPTDEAPANRDGAVMIDLDDFVTTVGEPPNAERIEPLYQPESSEPTVQYDDEGIGARSYRLVCPPRVNGELLAEISMRQPEQVDIDDWGNGGIASHRDFISRLTGVHPAVLKRLKWVDSSVLYLLFRELVPDFIVGEDL